MDQRALLCKGRRCLSGCRHQGELRRAKLLHGRNCGLRQAAPVNASTFNFEQSETLWGWTVGGGIEYALSQEWSVKVEYQHFDFGSTSFTHDGDVRHSRERQRRSNPAQRQRGGFSDRRRRQGWGKLPLQLVAKPGVAAQSKRGSNGFLVGIGRLERVQEACRACPDFSLFYVAHRVNGAIGLLEPLVAPELSGGCA